MKRLHLMALAALSGAALVGCSSSDNGAHVNLDHPAGITSESMAGPHQAGYVAGPTDQWGNPNPPGITSQSMIGPRPPRYVTGSPARWAAPNPAGITASEMNGPNEPSDDDAVPDR